MSKYSGKCDLWDTACMHQQGIEDFITTTEFYIGKHKLDIRTKLDLLKYAPYLLAVMVYGNGKRNITLSNESYVDTQEKEMLQYYLDRVLKQYRKCKRHKTPFTFDNLTSGHYFNEAWNRDIIYRVQRDGENATTENIYLPVCEMFRQEHMHDLMKEGMSFEEAKKWVYGTIL